MRSPALMKAYYKEPEQTAATLTADGWLCTGDKGRLDKEGYLSITGRVKDIFKTSKGKYVAPAPVEDMLVMHPAIEACLVTGANLAQPVGLVMLNADAIAKSASAEGRTAITDRAQSPDRQSWSSTRENLWFGRALEVLAIRPIIRQLTGPCAVSARLRTE